MTVFNDTLEEYFWLNLQGQGNVNIPGLVFDDLLYEYIDLIDKPQTVNIEMVASEIDFSEALEPIHDLMLAESIGFSEIFGFPSRIKQVAVNVIHQPIVSPVDLCFMQVDIVHGVDVFREEISSGLHFPTEEDDVCRVAKFFKGWCYETLDMDMDSVPGVLDISKVIYQTSYDRINLRKEIDALWYFNNLSDERLFIYDKPGLGWQHDVEEVIQITDNARRYLGFVLQDYLFANSESSVNLETGNIFIEDKFFTYDVDRIIQGYSDTILDEVDLSGAMTVPYIENLLIELGLEEDIEGSNLIVSHWLKDDIKLKSSITAGLSYLLNSQDVFEMADQIPLSAIVKDYTETVRDSFNIGSEPVLNFLIEEVLTDIITGESSASSTWFKEIIVNDEIDFNGGIN